MDEVEIRNNLIRLWVILLPYQFITYILVGLSRQLESRI